MPSPTLVIGVGGTGLRVLLRTKERFIEAYDQMPKEVMLLELDTDPYQGKERETFNGVGLSGMGDVVDGHKIMASESEIYRIFTRNTDQKIDTILERDTPEWQWVDRIRMRKTINTPFATTINSGARTVRPISRAALFMDYQNVYQSLSNRINRLLDMIRDEDPSQEDNKGQIFVTASIAGGAGSGIVLDVLRIIEHIRNSRGTLLPVTVSCLLVGGSSFVKENDGQRTLSNTFAALRELDRFSAISGKMIVKAVPSVMVVPDPVGRLQSSIGPADNIYLFDRPDRFGRTRDDNKYGEVFLNSVITPSIADIIVAMADREYTPKFKSLDADLSENLKHGPFGEKGYFPYMSAGIHTLIFPERDVRWTAGYKLLSRIWDDYLVRPNDVEHNQLEGADLPPISANLWGSDVFSVEASQLVPYRFAQLAFMRDPVCGSAANNHFISTVVRSALSGEINLPPKYPNLLAFFTKGRTKIARVWALIGIPSTSKESYEQLIDRGERVAEWFDRRIYLLDNTNNKKEIDRWRSVNWGPGPVGSEDLEQGEWLKFLDTDEIIRGHKQDFTSVIISVVEELLNDKDEKGRILPYRLEYARRVLDRLDQSIDVWLHSKDGRNSRSLLSEYFDADLTSATEKRRRLNEIDPTKKFSAYKAAMIEYAKARREVFAQELLILLCTDLKKTITRIASELVEWRAFLRETGRIIKERQEEHRVSRENKLRLPIRTYVTDERFEEELFNRYKDNAIDSFLKSVYWSHDGEGGIYLRDAVFSKLIPALSDNPTAEHYERVRNEISLTSSELVDRAIRWACTKEGNPDRTDNGARPPLRDMAGLRDVDMATRIVDYFGEGNAQSLATTFTHETQIASLCPIGSNWPASRLIFSCVLPRFSPQKENTKFFDEALREISYNTNYKYNDRKIIHNKADNPRHAFAMELASGFRLQDRQDYKMYLENYLKDNSQMNALHCLPEEINASSYFEQAINTIRNPDESNELLDGLNIPKNTLLDPVVVDVLGDRKRLEQFVKARALSLINVKDDGDLYLYPEETNGDYQLSKMGDIYQRDQIISDIFYDVSQMTTYPGLVQVVDRMKLFYALRTFVLSGKCIATKRVIDYPRLAYDIQNAEKSIGTNVLYDSYYKLFLNYKSYYEKYIHEKPDNFIILAHLGLVLAIVARDCYESISASNKIVEKEVTKVDLPEEKNTSTYEENASSRTYFVATHTIINTRKIRLSIKSTSDFIQRKQKYSEATFLINAPGFFIDEGQNNVTVPVFTSGVAIDIDLEARFSGIHEVIIEPFLDKTPYSPISLSLTIPVKNNSTKDPLKLPNPLKNRVVPQPDICIRMYTSYFEDNKEEIKIDFILYSSVFSLHFPGSTPAGSTIINKSDLKRILVRLEKIVSLKNIGGKPQELSSIGHELYDLLFPNIMKKYYMEIYKSNIKNILIFSDPTLWIPWELIKPYNDKWEHDYLGIRFNIGKWIEGWGVLRQDEFPVGQVCLAGVSEYSKHYALSEWQNLFKKGDIPRLTKDLFIEWTGGIPAAMDYQTPVWGLHLEDIPDTLVEKSTDMVLLDDGKPLSPENVRSYALNLHAKRPLVTFGMRTQKNTSAFTRMEEKWLPTFIQSGASAFVGAMWAVQPEIDQLFWRSFYQSIWSGSALGEAVNVARRNVSDAYPESIDGLSYYLIGDPMSVGYVPPLGKAFVTLECLDHDVSQPMAVGKKYTFQASIRSAPPIWYKDRLHQSTDSKWDEPKLQVIGNGCDVTPSKLMTFTEVSPSYLICRFELTPRERKRTEVEAGDEEIFFNFLSGADREIIKSISLPVIIKSLEVGE